MASPPTVSVEARRGVGVNPSVLDAPGRAALSGAMVQFQFELDPREVSEFVRGMPLRRELVYRLAVRGLCARCRGDRQFKACTDALIGQFRKELPTIMGEAEALGRELVEAVAAR
ncbi:MAG TPA: hypothetical protein VMA53_07605 [Stellaceae bacterium]|nr:hypothetical protein [Stellaceae bacterium]